MSQPVEQDKKWNDLRHLFTSPPPPLGVPFAEEPNGQTVNINEIVTDACSRFSASLKESVAAFQHENMQEVKGAVLKIISEQFACNEDKMVKVVHNAWSQQTTNLAGLKDIIAEAWVVTFDKLNERGAFQEKNLEEVRDAVVKIISEQYACNEDKLAKVVQNACSQQTTNLAGLKDIIAEAWVVTFDKLNERGAFQKKNLEEVKDAVVKIISEQYAYNEDKLAKVVHNACSQQTTNLDALKDIVAEAWVLTLDRLKESNIEERLHHIVKKACSSAFLEAKSTLEAACLEEEKIATRLMKASVSEFMEHISVMKEDVIKSNDNLFNQLKECTSQLISCAQEIRKVKEEIVDDLLKAEKSVIMNDNEESPQAAASASYKPPAPPLTKRVTWASDQLPKSQERLSLRSKGGSENHTQLQDEIEKMLGDDHQHDNSADEGPDYSEEEVSGSPQKSGPKKEPKYKRILDAEQSLAPEPKKKKRAVTPSSLSLRGKNRASPRATRSRNSATNNRKQGHLDPATDDSSEGEVVKTRAGSAKEPDFSMHDAIIEDCKYSKLMSQTVGVIDDKKMLENGSIALELETILEDPEFEEFLKDDQRKLLRLYFSLWDKVHYDPPPKKGIINLITEYFPVSLTVKLLTLIKKAEVKWTAARNNQSS